MSRIIRTQIPDGFYVAIEKHRKVVAPEISGIILCYWEEKYCTIGVEEAEIANHKVKIFCIEKSVCDAVKFRNKIGTEVAVEILRNYLKRKERNISRLMDYAKQMRVLSTMRQYLEMGLKYGKEKCSDVCSGQTPEYQGFSALKMVLLSITGRMTLRLRISLWIKSIMVSQLL